MAFKNLKHIMSAVLSAVLTIIEGITAVHGESSPLAAKPSETLYSNSNSFKGEIGSVSDVVRGPVSVLGLTGSFKETNFYEQIDADSQKIYNGILKEYNSH